MEKAMAPHSSALAWKIPWTEEPGRLQSMGSLRVRHDWVTSLSRIGKGNGNPLYCSCLENPRDGGAWWAAVYGVAQSRAWLTRLSSSSSNQGKGSSFFSPLPDDAISRKTTIGVSHFVSPCSFGMIQGSYNPEISARFLDRHFPWLSYHQVIRRATPWKSTW